MTILFVCSGNMHRSAVARTMLIARLREQERNDIEVISAGTLGLDGEAALAEAVKLAREHGLDLSHHRSRALRREDIARSDLILAMEKSHRQAVTGMCPEAAGRCRLLSEFAGLEGPLTPGADVPDAIGESLDRFRVTWGILEHCIDRLAGSLNPTSQDDYIAAIDAKLMDRRGSALPLSATDWQLTERWWSLGVPLWMILQSIDDVFDRRMTHPGGAPVRGLSYFESLIHERYESLRGSRREGESAGADHPNPSILARRRLEEAGRLARERGQEAVCKVLAAAAEETKGFDEEDESTSLMELGDLQDRLTKSLESVMPLPVRERITQACLAELEAYRARMTPEAFDTTLTRLIGVRVREENQVPDLVG